MHRCHPAKALTPLGDVALSLYYYRPQAGQISRLFRLGSSGVGSMGSQTSPSRQVLLTLRRSNRKIDSKTIVCSRGSIGASFSRQMTSFSSRQINITAMFFKTRLSSTCAKKQNGSSQQILLKFKRQEKSRRQLFARSVALLFAPQTDQSPPSEKQSTDGNDKALVEHEVRIHELPNPCYSVRVIRKRDFGKETPRFTLFDGDVNIKPGRLIEAAGLHAVTRGCHRLLLMLLFFMASSVNTDEDDDAVECKNCDTVPFRFLDDSDQPLQGDSPRIRTTLNCKPQTGGCDMTSPNKAPDD